MSSTCWPPYSSFPNSRAWSWSEIESSAGGCGRPSWQGGAMTQKEGFQRNAESVASHRCEVVEHRWVNDRYKYLRLKAPGRLAEATRAGQFYQLKCPVSDDLQPFLLRPMSVYGMGPEPETLEFLYNVTGLGTRAISDLAVGGHMDIVGPLGNTFRL